MRFGEGRSGFLKVWVEVSGTYVVGLLLFAFVLVSYQEASGGRLKELRKTGGVACRRKICFQECLCNFGTL